MGQTLLQLNQLSKSYGRLKAVNQLSMTIKKGKVYGLLGPNGSGKSTTLGMVLNVINPTSGSFQWYQGTLNTHQALKKIGAIIERPNFYPYMTALQNLKLICRIKQCGEKAIQEKLELVGLWDRRFSKFRTYSLGMKQRLAIAAALVNSPELLILDEPTNGLDPEGIHQIRELIKKISKDGTTILLASHLLDVGGTADAARVELAFRLILRDPDVEAILINIFGGIVRCDRVAQGIVDAYKNLGDAIQVPIIVRLQGTNADTAKRLIDSSGLNVLSATAFQEAADKVQEAIT